MYVSRNHPRHAELTAPRERPPAPEPSGRELARFDRPGFGRRADAQLRLSLDEFAGHPFLSARLWEKGAGGQFWPSKTGCSIRVGEAEDFAEAILEGLRLAHQTSARLPSTGPTRRRSTPGVTVSAPPSRGRRQDPPTPLIADTDRAEGYQADFDEFQV